MCIDHLVGYAFRQFPDITPESAPGKGGRPFQILCLDPGDAQYQISTLAVDQTGIDQRARISGYWIERNRQDLVSTVVVKDRKIDARPVLEHPDIQAQFKTRCDFWFQSRFEKDRRIREIVTIDPIVIFLSLIGSGVITNLSHGCPEFGETELAWESEKVTQYETGAHRRIEKGIILLRQGAGPVISPGYIYKNLIMKG